MTTFVKLYAHSHCPINLGDHLHSGELFFSTGNGEEALQRLVGDSGNGAENGETESS